jgi:D-tyrosyl-tRNA(Tyr) deacylase
MIALLQRVRSASVVVDSQEIAHIGEGLLVLVGVQKADGEAQAQRLAQRILGYRVFEDENGKMNCSLLDIEGGLLLVPQFTLAADTNKGMRPSFSSAAAPADGQKWFDRLVECCHGPGISLATGRFGADMKVGLVNDGPVTFWLQVD